MKNSIKTILLAFTATLIISSCTKSSNDICDTNQICYTQAPDDLHVKLEFSTNPSSTPRSEEHTSELQSRPHLVCRLLLEKKNQSLPNLITSIKYLLRV